jgi:hypothetical protein
MQMHLKKQNVILAVLVLSVLYKRHGRAMKKILYCIACSWTLHTLATPTTCTCIHNNDNSIACYIGSLELSQIPESKHLSVYYDGNIITVSNDMFCFKEHSATNELNYLFINPEHLQACNDRDVITGIRLAENAPYHFYRLSKKTHKHTHNKTSVTWNICKETIPTKQVHKNLLRVVPDHTIIIPLDASLFKQHKKSICFKYSPLYTQSHIIKLPTPTISATKNSALKEALVRAQLCIMNLKIFHSKQEFKRVHIDSHTLIQENT